MGVEEIKHPALNTKKIADGIEKMIDKHKQNLMNMSNEYYVEVALIKREVLHRDFTKRQLNIIQFILDYSCCYCKSVAIIPFLQDFEVCGVHRTKIKNELKKLVEMNVIHIEKDFNAYGVNPPEYWKVPYHKTFDSKTSARITNVNLRDAGYTDEKNYYNQ